METTELNINLRASWRDKSVTCLKIAEAIDTAPALFKSSYLAGTLLDEYRQAERWVSYWTWIGTPQVKNVKPQVVFPEGLDIPHLTM